MLTPSSTAPTLRVAIYRTSSLGDVVLATACLDLLEKLPVPTEVTWIGRGAALDVVRAGWPGITTIEVARSDSLVDLQRTLAKLSHHHLLIDLQCNLRSQWFARNLKAVHGVPFFAADKAQFPRNRLIVEARVRGRRKPLPEKARSAPRPQYEMMCDALRRGLRHHLPVEMRDGIDASIVRPRLSIPDTFDSPWRKELRFGAWLGVAPGASYPTKQAPLELMRETIAATRARLAALPSQVSAPLGLVFYGDNDDRQIARDLLDQLNWTDPVLNLAGRLSLWESAIALRETTVLLSNDSVLGHLAESVDTPVAVVFGPTIEGFGFAPRMRQSRAFSSLTGCRPCSKHGKIPCRFGDKLCFTTIASDSIAQYLVELLLSPDARHIRRASASGDAFSGLVLASTGPGVSP